MSWRPQRSRRAWLKTTIALAVLCPASASAALLAKVAHNAEIHYDPRIEKLADKALEHFAEAQEALRGRLGVAIRNRCTIMLCKNDVQFAKIAPGAAHWILGLARPDRNFIAINAHRLGYSGTDDIVVTLRHEMSHVVLGEVAARSRHKFPRWFDEGVAQWVSGKLYRERPDELIRAANGGALLPLGALREQFPRFPAKVRLAYLESESVVRFLVGQRGGQVIPDLLQRSAAGASFEDALPAASGFDVLGLEKVWIESLRSRHPKLYLLRSISLFTALAVLSLLIFVKRWLWRRRKLKEWEEEELFSEWK